MVVERTRGSLEGMPQDESGEFHGLDERSRNLELGRWGDGGQCARSKRSEIESKGRKKKELE